MPPASLAAVAALLLLFATGARAEPPQGAYELELAAFNRMALPSGSLTCEPEPPDPNDPNAPPEDFGCMSSTVETNALGEVAGIGNFEIVQTDPGELSLNLDLEFAGRMRGTTSRPFANLKVSAVGTVQGPPTGNPPTRDTLDAEGSGTMLCGFPFNGELSCQLRLRLCTFLEGRKLDCGPIGLTGRLRGVPTPIEIDLALESEGSRITGTGQIAVEEQLSIAGVVKGKHSTKRDTSNLKLTDPVSRAKLSLKNAVLENGEVTAAKVVFKIAGLKGKAEIVPPAPAPEP